MHIKTNSFSNVGASEAEGAKWTRLPGAVLYNALHRVLPVASKDRERPHVNAVALGSDGTRVTMVATDGYRLSVAAFAADGEPFSTVLPRDVARVLEAAIPDPAPEFVELAPERGLLRLGGDTFRVKLSDTSFPPYQQVVPAKRAARAVVARRALRQAALAAARIDPRGYNSSAVMVEVERARVVSDRHRREGRACAAEQLRRATGSRLGGPVRYRRSAPRGEGESIVKVGTLVLVVMLAVLAGCGGGGAAEGGAGGEGGSGGAVGGGAGAEGGGTATTTDTCETYLSNGECAPGVGTGGGGGTEPKLCGSAAIEPFDCGHKYPNKVLAYDPSETMGITLQPAAGESPGGAAAGRVDVTEGTVVAVLVGVGLGLPDAPRVAAWQEPLCGVPASSPLWQDVQADEITFDPSTGLNRLPLLIPTTLDPAKGQAWAGVSLTGYDVALIALPTHAEPHEPRAAWLGLADKDCNGVTDTKVDGTPALGWELLPYPSAPPISAFPYDLQLGVELAPDSM